MQSENLVKCHFTVEELEFFSMVMFRERVLYNYVREHLRGLELLHIRLHSVPELSVTGKLLSYIKKGKEQISDDKSKTKGE